MKGTAYGERDYGFGQRMLTLRTRIRLSQAALARRLGVSRQSVVEWEVGNSYPREDHLKVFIELAVEMRAFTSGHEQEAIRELWLISRQKVLLDEEWLQKLLNSTNTSKSPVAEIHIQAKDQLLDGPKVDWGDALAVAGFYGRDHELVLLTQWIVQDSCRVVSVLGLGGVGKSALTVTLMHQIATHFDVVIWRSLRDAPSCEAFLDSCLAVFSPHLRAESTSFAERLEILLRYLHTSRTLLVLDNLEQLLEEGVSTGRFRPGYEGYGELLRRVAQTEHHSCLLLTSREKLSTLVAFEGDQMPVRVLHLTGLDSAACERIIDAYTLRGNADDHTHLIDAFNGNPLALKIVAQSIMDLFGGVISTFLAQETVVFGSIRDVLSEQFQRLSAIEQTILLWLAIVREPVNIETVFHLLGLPLARAQIIEAIEGLRRRSLVEQGVRAGSFTLQSVVLEYTTTQLIVEVVNEIEQGQPRRLIEHSLELAITKEYVRQIQEHLIVCPVLEQLRSLYPLRGALEERLLALLDQQRERAEYAQGYGPANLLTLLRLLRGHLRGLDLSHLSVRGAYLQGVDMQDTLLEEAELRETVFTEAFAAPWVIAMSPDGYYRVVGNRRGEVQIWREEGRILEQVWLAHASVVQAIAFSPDGQTIVTGSCDSAIKMWNREDAALLWAGQHSGSIRNLAFSPDGCTLASGGEATIALWDAASGTQLRTLTEQSSPVYALAWSADGQLLASGNVDGSIRLWRMQDERPDASVCLFSGHTDLVWSVAFAPDGHTLASASFDGTVRIWDFTQAEGGRILTGHTGPVNVVAWNADGSLLASCGSDATIRVWDCEQWQMLSVLYGHNAAVQTITFLADGHSLLSGSADGSLRVWDVRSGLCHQLLQGYAVTLSSLSWNPMSTRLATGSSDAAVTIWNQDERDVPQMLRGHQRAVNGVHWSPDGRLLASGSLDHTVRIWDTVTAACLQILRDPGDPQTTFSSVAWSPDSRLLAVGSVQGEVLVWDMTTGSLLWRSHGRAGMTRCLAWSHDGRLLASCANDGDVILWNVHDGTCYNRLSGHPSMALGAVWSPDGTLLATCGGGRGSGEIFIWDVHNGTRLRSIGQHSVTISALAWSPDGATLVSGDFNRMLSWWNVRSGSCIRVQEAHQGIIQSLQISPDGKLLASCGDDNVIHIRELERGHLLSTQRHDRPYERLHIAGIRGLTQAQKTSLYALGAIDQPTIASVRHLQISR